MKAARSIYLSTSAAALSVVLVIMMWATNPTAIGPVGVTAWFVGLLLALSLWLSVLFLGITKLFRRPTEFHSLWRQGILFAIWLTSLLALSSLGQLGVRDVLLMALLLVIIEFYLRTRS